MGAAFGVQDSAAVRLPPGLPTLGYAYRRWADLIFFRPSAANPMLSQRKGIELKPHW
jgi:hypothetical protein